MIKYSLVKSRLSTAGSSPYMAKTVQSDALSFEDFIKAVSYGSTATAADVRAVMENLERVCTENLAQGRSINLGFCILKSMVKGSFNGPEDGFSEEKNWIKVKSLFSPSFEKKVSLEAKISRISGVKSVPVPAGLTNHSGTAENKMRAADLATLRGENLKFDSTVPEQGIFFSGNGGEVKAIEYSQVKSKSVTFKVPAGLNPGSSYKLLVRNLFGKELRTGEMDSSILAE
ncbi:MAG TPA: DNA-binding domain-containing protein [Leptospiraceae bacterium]|nr:DNA-binding domain-containing protein [Leptospiraceae bacterium]HNM06528.1 DNA-binding domain-containing protein [Leptospiraceae bacterium]